MAIFDDVEPPSVQTNNRGKVLIGVALVIYFVTYLVGAPGNMTLGAHIVVFVIKLVSYTVILLGLSALAAAATGKLKTHTLLIFGWLLLAAVLLDLGVVAYRKFVIEPNIRRFERTYRQ